MSYLKTKEKYGSCGKRRTRVHRVMAFFLSACLLFSLCGCNNGKEDELREDVKKLESKNKKLNDQINDLEEEKESLNDEITSLKEENEKLRSEKADVDPTPVPDDDPPPQSSMKVGISMPTKDLMRWDEDGTNMKRQLESSGLTVDLQYANYDVSTQIAQIESMINSGCKVLVIAAIDGPSLWEVVDEAHEKGIAVIAYDRLIYNCEGVDYYITFDNYLVGALQGKYIEDMLDLENTSSTFNIEITAGEIGDPGAGYFYNGAMDVLKPYIDSGRLVVVSGQTAFDEVCTESWKTDVAQTRAENIIATFYSDGAEIDAWLCSNDSTALGVENALATMYTGKYPVITGQDCDLANMKNMLAGWQSMSVFKDTRILVSWTVEMVKDIADGKPVPVNDTTTFDNGEKIVPAYLCAPIVVTIDNYHEALIESGYYNEDQLS